MTLNIDDKLNSDIEKLADKNQQSKEEFILKILEYKLLEEFVSANQPDFLNKAIQAGFHSESDLLNNIS